MRKLLLGTTALAAVTLTTNAALAADLSISGYYEFAYQSRGSDVAKNDGTSMATDSEIKFSFKNKTDSGLEVGMAVEMDADVAAFDETNMYIKGGFGTLLLGSQDGAGDKFAIDAEDVVSEEIQATGTDTLTLIDTDLADTSDSNKITYLAPAMGGFQAGISYLDDGTDSTTGAQDSIEMGAQYTVDAGAATITVAGATRTTEQVSGTVDTEGQNIGVTVSAGNITAKVAQSTLEATNADEEANGVGVSLKVSDDMTLGAYTIKIEDGTGTTDEEYTNSGAEVAYTIASGLTAYLNISDYDYKTGAGTGAGTTADSGTVSKLTIIATF
jgi:hypothetical protein